MTRRGEAANWYKEIRLHGVGSKTDFHTFAHLGGSLDMMTPILAVPTTALFMWIAFTALAWGMSGFELCELKDAAKFSAKFTAMLAVVGTTFLGFGMLVVGLPAPWL